MTKSIAMFAFCMWLSGGMATLWAEDVDFGRELKTHCWACHGQDGTVEGDVNLTSLKTLSDVSDHPDLLEALVQVLKDRQMPPEDAPPMDDSLRAAMIAKLEFELRRLASTQPFVPTPIRRMNRFQYNNAVVDLLELERDVFQLNERLMRRREDYFHPETRKMPDTVRVSCRPLSKDIDNQRPEGFRGVAPFPQDQRAEHGFDNRADHLTLSPLLMESFLQLSQSIGNSPDLNSAECGVWDHLFTPHDGGVESGKYEAEDDTLLKVVGEPSGSVEKQELKQLDEAWSGDAHLLWKCPDSKSRLTISFEAAIAAKGLRFRFTKARNHGRFDVLLDGIRIARTVELFNPHTTASELEVRGLKLEPGTHQVTFECVGKRGAQHFMGLDYVELLGIDVSSNVDLLVDVMRKRLPKFLRRAFRRPVDDDTLNRFLSFGKQQLASGVSYEVTMRTMVGAVLGMPEFLYFYETASDTDDATPGRQPIDDFELASRLSQFFWSSIPDETLLDLAAANELRKPEVLSGQIDRMLDDQRSSRFCENFPAQWLQLDRLVTSIPDKELFPYFYYNGYRTSMHMMSEPLLLFETVFVEDRSVIDLLDPAFTYQSSMLEANYAGKGHGNREVLVQQFKRVALDDPRRGGVITNAAVMTMTSTPTRTQPITRGAWINEVIFNDPPEPPPADVPPLPEANAEELEKLTIRERLAVHRERADCAGCHNKIDPLGFALENYGPTGVWRDEYENGRGVDVSGVLLQQHEFSSLFEFKKLIVDDKSRFFRAFSAHLLSYALGRKLGMADSPTLDEISAQAVDGDDSLRTLLKKIAMSEPFLQKNTPGSRAASQQVAVESDTTHSR